MAESADPRRFPFSEGRLRAIPDPAPRVKCRYHDTSCPGLALRVMGSTRAFIFYAKANGRPVELRPGSWPALTVKEVRKLVKAKVAPDPAIAAEARRPQREANTLTDAWAALEANPTHRRDVAPLRPATWRNYQAA